MCCASHPLLAVTDFAFVGEGGHTAPRSLESGGSRKR
jgi:hypothetical protein